MPPEVVVDLDDAARARQLLDEVDHVERLLAVERRDRLVVEVRVADVDLVGEDLGEDHDLVLLGRAVAQVVVVQELLRRLVPPLVPGREVVARQRLEDEAAVDEVLRRLVVARARHERRPPP